MAAYIWDNEDGVSRDDVGKYCEHWEVNSLRRPTRRNGNGGFYGSVSVSRKGATNKEASRPEYQTWDSGNGGGVFTSRIGHGISEADHGSSNGWQTLWRGAKDGN